MKLRLVIFQECRLATICVSGVYCVYQGGQSNMRLCMNMEIGELAQKYDWHGFHLETVSDFLHGFNKSSSW